MGIDPNQEQVVAVQTPPFVEALPAVPAEAYPPAPVYAPVIEPAPLAQAPIPPAAKHGRPGWILPAAVAVIGLIASGSLGYLFYTTNNSLEATRHQLTETQLTLESTKKDLDTEKAQAAYVQLYENDLGRLSTDYAQLTECDTYSACRSIAQTMLSDTEAFQSDHQTAKVPAAYANVDGMLGDSLTAELTALKNLITALGSRDMTKVQDGFTQVNDATLSVFKTESALGKMIS